ncbi:uncharacterized protein LOC129595250 [Paramacrobiotus metropolitanus]|uniref:uncharacterized protein LOC129595250 n=1 Tax=Paramacrobiotus metropolitanus TaxID=2943436 RepID=UPI00244640AB|nr:uncharacterized protein LOC129595250 [Paramacrobiotus metropolitanus]
MSINTTRFAGLTGLVLTAGLLCIITPYVSATTVPVALEDDNLDCVFERDFCGWKPYIVNSTWRRSNTSDGAINGIRPPNGTDWMAYAISTSESWAELESPEFTHTDPANLTFAVVQTRSDFGSRIHQAQLFLRTVKETDTQMIWSTVSSFKWTRQSVIIPPAINIRLLFRFRVGFDRQIAAIANINVRILPGYVMNSTEPSTTKESKQRRTQVAVDLDKDVSCSFALDECGWAYSADSDVSWRRTKEAGSPFLSVEAPRNSSDPYFLEFRGVESNEIVRSYIISEPIHNQRPRNLSFYYTKRGENYAGSVFELLLDRLDENVHNITMRNSSHKVIWSAPIETDYQKRKWKRTTVLINDTGTISLRFICAANYYIFCGIDDVVLQDEIETPNSATSVVVQFLTMLISVIVLLDHVTFS